MLVTTIILLVLFIIFVIVANKDSYIENERKNNKEFTAKVVKSINNILKYMEE